jgi:hypothetical protein
MPYCPNCTRIAREKLAACFGELIELAMMVKAAAPYVHARKAPEYSKGRTVPPMYYVRPDLEEPE